MLATTQMLAWKSGNRNGVLESFMFTMLTDTTQHKLLTWKKGNRTQCLKVFDPCGQLGYFHQLSEEGVYAETFEIFYLSSVLVTQSCL